MLWGAKLSPDGRFLVQFLQHVDGGGHVDAPLENTEPSVSWTSAQIVEMLDSVGLRLLEIRTIRATPGALWHWTFAARK